MGSEDGWVGVEGSRNSFAGMNNSVDEVHCMMVEAEEEAVVDYEIMGDGSETCVEDIDVGVGWCGMTLSDGDDGTSSVGCWMVAYCIVVVGNWRTDCYSDDVNYNKVDLEVMNGELLG